MVMIAGLLGLSGIVVRANGDTASPAPADAALSQSLFLPVIRHSKPVYFDDFDDPSSGWYVGAALRYNDFCDWVGDVGDCEGWQEVAYLNYVDSHYRFYIPLTWHGGGNVDTWFVWPVQTAPLPELFYPLPRSYCIEAVGVFSNYVSQDYQPWWAHWGIVFGANESLSEVYTFQVNANHDFAVLRYHNYTYPGDRQPLDGSEVNVEIPLLGWSGDWKESISSHGYNKLFVAVQGQVVDVYVNDKFMGRADIPGMPRGRVGLVGGPWEVTPVQIDVSHFRYDPYCGR